MKMFWSFGLYIVRSVTKKRLASIIGPFQASFHRNEAWLSSRFWSAQVAAKPADKAHVATFFAKIPDAGLSAAELAARYR
jgi:hypothetical protein